MAIQKTGRALVAAVVLLSWQASAEQIRVMISGGFSEPYKALVPDYEKQTGDEVVSARGPSMGETPQAIPNRLMRGEPADLVIMARSALDGLVKQGKVAPGSEVDLVRSQIGMAVKAGARVPDISSVESFKRALLEARSIAYSDSASGVYISKEMFQRLGIAAEVAAKSKMIPATPVGMIVAGGEAEIGFQQLSELLPVAGIHVIGPIPEGVQQITIFSAGITTTAKAPTAARRLVDYLVSEKSWPAIRRAGLEPAAAVKTSATGSGKR
jgi:molybdate transport system substrate-binding protein